MSWMVSVLVPEQEVDAVASLLWDHGTNGVAEPPIAPASPASLIAGFDDQSQADAAVEALADRGFPATVAPYVADWARPGPVSVIRQDVELTIEVGEAFGHGSHPTTELCLDLLLQQLQNDPATPCSVLDVGTGTGILAIAAARSGARPVVAVENDPAARTVAAANISANNVDIALTSRLGPPPSGSEPPSFDLLVANLLLADLRPLARTFERVARRLILGGFLIDQETEVSALFADWAEVQRAESDGWVGLVLDHPTEGASRR